MIAIALTVNGDRHDVEVEPRRLLSDVLRQDLGLTGTHVGCEHGVCGACTVLLDGRPVRSCLLLAVSAQDGEITTVEGLANADGSLGPVQQAFAECHGLQCGFCTPGFVVSITALLRDNPNPTDDLEPASDLHGSAAFRRHLAAVATCRALTSAVARAGGAA